ncbi:5487_t:CDS:2 [Diversispora eburnea]|uniref:5487_t:CDS:1 n=1 Tax=Diversispora eburnea TaxID=1213867 RepID=A0A9N9FVW2_9GLOM|nr:5487_t:CDS:2 [Diversispora eburnea]
MGLSITLLSRWNVFSKLDEGHNLLMITDSLLGTMDYPKFIFFHEKATLYRMAAGFGESIIKNHPFLDGNKRAGHLAISTFLLLNGYDLINANKKSSNINIDMLEFWIAK